MAIPNLALVVDDEAHVRTFVALMMKEIGVENTLAAADAETGYALYQQNRPGVVVIDLHLPGGASGLELLKRIRSSDTDVYTVIFSCEASSAMVMSAVNAGADGYIRKDTRKEDIVRQFRDVMDDSGDEGGE